MILTIDTNKQEILLDDLTNIVISDLIEFIKQIDPKTWQNWKIVKPAEPISFQHWGTTIPCTTPKYPEPPFYATCGTSITTLDS